MMAPGFENGQSREEAVTVREPLVDINTESACPTEPKIQLKLGRKRLSDVNNPVDPPASDPKPQRRRLSDTAETDSQEPAAEPRPVSGRAKLKLVQPQTASASADSPKDAGGSRLDAGLSPISDQPGRTAPIADPAWIDRWIAELRSRQSLSLGIVTGLLAAVVGAMLWAAITVLTNAQIGWMAVGVAALVGVVVRTLGRGLDRSFGWLGAGLSLFSCILGNYLANCVFIAREVELPVTSVLTQINPAAIPGLMVATFHPLDVLFYGLAIWMGYRLSFRQITEAQIRQALLKA
jgi:hypothetical protein